MPEEQGERTQRLGLGSAPWLVSSDSVTVSVTAGAALDGQETTEQHEERPTSAQTGTQQHGTDQPTRLTRDF